jgi:hypothetical protein
MNTNKLFGRCFLASIREDSRSFVAKILFLEAEAKTLSRADHWQRDSRNSRSIAANERAATASALKDAMYTASKKKIGSNAGKILLTRLARNP